MLPLFGIIIAGFLAVRFKILGVNAAHVLHRFVFYFALPLLLFRSLATGKIAEILNWPYMGAFVASMLILFGLMYIVARFALPQHPLYNSFRAFAASYPNAGYIGLPFLYVVFGPEGLVPAALTNVLTTVLVLVMVVLLDMQVEKKPNLRLQIQGALIKTLRNPAVFAPIIGIVFSFFEWQLPKGIDSFCLQLGNAAIPCALFAIGLNLKVGSFFSRPLAYSTVMVFKLIAHPLLMLGLSLWLGIERDWAVTGFLLAAMPTGVLTSVFAHRYKAYEVQSDTLIFLTTLFSLVTLSIYLLIVPLVWGKV